MKNQVVVAVFCWLVTIPGELFSQEIARQSVRETIRESFDGTFVGAAKDYQVSDVPELIAMLNSEDEEEYWSRAVGVLGVVGDNAVAYALIDFIEEPIVGPVYISQARHDARAEAIKALGYLVAGTGSEQALDYLTESLDDTIWRRRNILGVIDYLDTYDRYDRQLSIYAIMGLAYSGHPRAGEALRSLQLFPRPEQARLRNGLDGVLDTWLEVHHRVADKGLEGL
jgi:hypothetical protein